MWNLFENKRAKAAEARAAAIETQFNQLVDKLEYEERVRAQQKKEEEAEKQRILDEENALIKAAEEADKIKNAHKNIATERGDPWVNIIDIDIDAEKLAEGSIELDWNDEFVKRLRKNGFVGETDDDVVDMWFTNFCRHIINGTYEQANSDIGENVTKQDIGNGRVEYT